MSVAIQLSTAMILAALATRISAAETDEILLARAHAQVLAGLTTEQLAQADAWLASLPADGWWPDLPVQQDVPTSWKPRDHMLRLSAIAALSGPGGPWLDRAGAAAAAVERGVAAWEQRKPICKNWWYNRIGVPLLATQILASRPDLSAETRKRLIAICGTPLQNPMTGQNRVWLSRIALLMGAVQEDRAVMQQAVEYIRGTLVATTDEGPQPDASFHQHGPQFMSGAYGWSWIQDIGEISWLLAGTDLAIPDDAWQVFERTTLDGVARLLRGGYLDPTCMGRAFTRSRGHTLVTVPLWLTALAERESPRRAEWAAFAATVARSAPYAWQGSAHYWRSDASIVQYQGFSAGILAATRRTLRMECINGENLLGRLAADGTTWIRRAGDEGLLLAPVMDWGALPGTVHADGEKLLPAGIRVEAESTFGGGCASDRLLAHGWDIARGGISGAQAWFAVRQGLVVLLAGITSPSGHIRATGPVLPERGAPVRDGAEIGDGSVLSPGGSLVHDGLTWMAVEGTWTVNRQRRSGSWQRINQTQPASPVELAVVSLETDLGEAPRDRAVGWAVLEAGAVQPPGFSVLANTRTVQAVQDVDGSLLAVFRAPGKAGGIAVEEPLVVIVDRGARRLVVADPCWTKPQERGRTIRLMIDGQACTVALPGGPMTGGPVAIALP